jgi:hypothetical protein
MNQVVPSFIKERLEGIMNNSLIICYNSIISTGYFNEVNL